MHPGSVSVVVGVSVSVSVGVASSTFQTLVLALLVINMGCQRRVHVAALVVLG